MAGKIPRADLRFYERTKETARVTTYMEKYHEWLTPRPPSIEWIWCWKKEQTARWRHFMMLCSQDAVGELFSYPKIYPGVTVAAV